MKMIKVEDLKGKRLYRAVERMIKMDGEEKALEVIYLVEADISIKEELRNVYERLKVNRFNRRGW